MRLCPELKVYKVRGKDAWNLAKNKGAKCRLIKCYPGSHCYSDAIPGFGFTQDIPKPRETGSPLFLTGGETHVNGGKFEFDLFYSFNLNPGWTFVEYYHRLRETKYFLPIPGDHAGQKILRQPQEGSRNIYLKVRLWADPAITGRTKTGQPEARIKTRNAWFWIQHILIKGPNCRDPLDAFR